MGRLFQVRLWNGELVALCAHKPKPILTGDGLFNRYQMEMGVQFIKHAPWNDRRCNVAQLENGYIMTTTEIQPEQELRMDWNVIADHN